MLSNGYLSTLPVSCTSNFKMISSLDWTAPISPPAIANGTTLVRWLFCRYAEPTAQICSVEFNERPNFKSSWPLFDCRLWHVFDIYVTSQTTPNLYHCLASISRLMPGMPFCRYVWNNSLCWARPFHLKNCVGGTIHLIFVHILYRNATDAKIEEKITIKNASGSMKKGKI